MSRWSLNFDIWTRPVTVIIWRQQTESPLMESELLETKSINVVSDSLDKFEPENMLDVESSELSKSVESE